MKIQFASDLHLEFRDNREYYYNHPIEPVGEILLLAGDIVPFIKLEEYRGFFRFCSFNFKKTYWIPGNHEYYGSDISGRSAGFEEEIEPNVYLINNRQVMTDDTQLIFSTLWTPIPDENAEIIQRSIADYQMIHHGDVFFTPAESNRLFAANLDFIKKSVSESRAGKSIIITHHVPTLQHYPDDYQGSKLNGAFAVDLNDLIEQSQADYWIYGHHHRNVGDFQLGKTTLVTNQMGYVVRGEQEGYNPERVIEI